MSIQHLRSSTANKRPTPAAMSDGQIAVNTNTASPGLFFKDSAGALIKVGPVHVGTTAPNASPASGGETGNTVGEQWLDTTGGTYVFKVWDGSAWRSESGTFVDVNGDVMTGALGIIAGSAGSPGLYFSGDTNTGLYSPGADQVAISTGGSGRLFVDASGAISTSSTAWQGGAAYQSNGFQLGGTTYAKAVLQTGGTSRAEWFFDSADNYLQAKSGGFYIANTTANPIGFYTNGSERLRITSAGLVGVGTSSPVPVTGFGTLLTVANNAGGGIVLQDANTTLGYRNKYIASVDGEIHFGKCADDGTSPTTQVLLDHTGRLGIGITSPVSKLHVAGDSFFEDWIYSGNSKGISSDSASRPLLFGLGGTERARIDSSGRLLVGTSSTSANTRIVAVGNSFGGNGRIDIDCDTATPASGDGLGYLVFGDNTQSSGAFVGAERDGGTWSGSSKPSRLVFSTTADGASSPTERMRITSNGRTLIGTTNTSPVSANVAGTMINSNGEFQISRDNATPLLVNRKTSDGNLVEFWQDGANEGSISVSGTTVSYNGAHLSRWTQLPGGAERTEILRGTVLSNIDEMCEWGEEDNEQLNRMKVSDVEGDKNVSGVFQAWDDDDDTYTKDFYCAMTGDFIIRIGAGVTVERGDLLMSAGDGTAKPQDDDIIRSKTIAKVTSTNVSYTYDDGSYCVPCVLMAC